MIKDSNKNLFDTVIVWKLDRFVRNRYDSARHKATLKKNGVSVELHIDHPRKSKCNCPHADGKRIICKHIVATYFTLLPKEAERFYAEAMAYQEEEEKRQEEMSDKVIEYVGKMKKADLCQSLLGK